MYQKLEYFADFLYLQLVLVLLIYNLVIIKLDYKEKFVLISGTIKFKDAQIKNRYLITPEASNFSTL